MSVYHRYASREHDREHFGASPVENTNPPVVFPFNGQFIENDDYSMFSTSIDEWRLICESSTYFVGTDPSFFGNVIIMVFKNVNSNKLCTRSFSKFGYTAYNNLILTENSRFYPACANLLPKYKTSKIRKALAITILKNYSRISNNSGSFDSNDYLKDNITWDETDAGSLANSMVQLEEFVSPSNLGILLLKLGLVQNHHISSLHIDVVSNNPIDTSNDVSTLLGESANSILDPLLEYSPEAMHINYQPNQLNMYSMPDDSSDTRQILDELISVQTNYSMGLVNLLQNLIIPLRIAILDTSDKNGITKLNNIFPPTIDEITRINCILNDSLLKANEYGSKEAFKAISLVLPYFYKPFIRHEANLPTFNAVFKKFYEKQHSKVFKNDNINKGGYSYSEIVSIICGSIAELPKLKLIVNRLYDSIKDVNEREMIHENYMSIISVIDSFGSDSQAFTTDSRNRVFTPTGKILTELASNWPMELQYGWLSRQVIGIYECRNIAPSDTVSPIEVLVIFSDHLLFLTLLDKDYNTDLKKKQISIADLLMHSLVNQKPISDFTQFLAMEVSCWCSINDVFISSYKSATDHNLSGEFIKFSSTFSTGFKSKSSTYPIYSKSYELVNSSSGSDSQNTDIIELINKAKILSKSQKLNLFKSTNQDFRVYSTTLDIESYEKESSKSPYALFLNVQIDDLAEYMDTVAGLKLAIHGKVVDNEKIFVSALGGAGKLKINKMITQCQFQPLLQEILVAHLQYSMMFDTELSSSVVNGNDENINYAVKTFIAASDIRQANDIKPIKAPKLDKQIENPNPIESVTKPNKTENTVQPSGKAKSFMHYLIKPFKRSVLPNADRPLKESDSTASFAPGNGKLIATNLILPIPDIHYKEPRNNASTKAVQAKHLNKDNTRMHSSIIQKDIEDNETIIYKHQKRGTFIEGGATGQAAQLKNFGESSIKIPSKREEIRHRPSKSLASSIFEVSTLDRTQISDNIELNPSHINQFYNDGASNWTALSRDHSSVFVLDAEKLIEEIAADRPTEFGFNTHDTSNVVDNFITSFENDEFHRATETRATSNGSSVEFAIRKRDISVQSLTASMYAKNFEQELDRTFASTLLLESINESDTHASNSSTHSVKSNTSKESSTTTISGFHSPEEYFDNQHSSDEKNYYSSEETITNEMNQVTVEAFQKIRKSTSPTKITSIRYPSDESDKHSIAGKIFQKLRISSGHNYDK